jgi:hypothetical protein
MKLVFKANCGTTAMGIMPHRDIDKALKLVLSLDIPFWPQLPHVSFYEDMYAQFSQHFPGIVVDAENTKLSFDTSRFEKELEEYSQRMEDPRTFALSEEYSVVYHRFLAENLSNFMAIRGQLIGPVSFGFRVTDENDKPIIYNDEVKTILFDFIQRKVNVQYRELREKNPHAFVWLDEPGLGWVFSGLSGYTDIPARQDYRSFLSGVEGLKALHLCANVNLPYLLQMGTELISFDAFQIECIPKEYAKFISEFITSGGVLCWGIVPTVFEALNAHSPQSLADILLSYWKVVSENSSIPLKQIAEQALIAPARCCLKNIGQVGAGDDIKSDQANHPIDLSIEEQVVEKAFGYLGRISETLRLEFNLK